MNTEQVIDKLNSLIQLDIDAVNAYTQAIERIDVQSIREELEKFRSDHERHIDNLGTSVRQLGGEPPERKGDFKGFVIAGFTALRSVTGTEGALKAMKTNEELTNRTYEKALEEDLPADVRDIVRQNREDERRHLSYIEQALEQRIWEHGREQHP